MFDMNTIKYFLLIKFFEYNMVPSAYILWNLRNNGEAECAIQQYLIKLITWGNLGIFVQMNAPYR